MNRYEFWDVLRSKTSCPKTASRSSTTSLSGPILARVDHRSAQGFLEVYQYLEDSSRFAVVLKDSSRFLKILKDFRGAQPWQIRVKTGVSMPARNFLPYKYVRAQSGLVEKTE